MSSIQTGEVGLAVPSNRSPGSAVLLKQSNTDVLKEKVNMCPLTPKSHLNALEAPRCR
jgi:hypothetical protein